MHIFLLGADGFIGRHIATHLRQHGHHVVACARRVSALEQMGFTTFQADLTKPVNWAAALKGCGLRKIILISAVGLEANTPFAHHRRAGEAVVLAAGLPTVIPHPSMVLDEASCGGLSLGQ